MYIHIMTRRDKREVWKAEKFFMPKHSRRMPDCKFYSWLIENFEEDKMLVHNWLRMFLESQGFDAEKHRLGPEVLSALKGVFKFAWSRVKVERNSVRWQDIIQPISPPSDREQIQDDANCYNIRVTLPGVPLFRANLWFKLMPKLVDLFSTEPAPWRLHPSHYKFLIDFSRANLGEFVWSPAAGLSGDRALCKINNLKEMPQELMNYVKEHKLNYPDLWVLMQD